ncbi:MAG: tetratricopeptide repeat protein, partial [Caulobacterales bacterium]|nr:tetratricopeptide repeat protein [Caulobacterales bacterium]
DGSGRSTLARAFCQMFADDYDMIWWLHAETHHAIVEGLAGFLTRLDASFSGVADVNALAREARRRAGAWPGGKPVLVVFDHAASVDAVREWLPRGAARALVITDPEADEPGVETVRIGALDEDRAARMLAPGAGAAEEAAARELARELRGIPIAVAHAAASVRANPLMTCASYLDRLRRAPRSDGADPDAQITAATCALAMSDAVVHHPAALAVLSIAAWCAAERVPVELLAAAAEHAPGSAKEALSDADTVEAALSALASYALITLEEDELGAVFSVHRVVRENVRARLLREQTATLWAGAAIEGAAAIIPGGAATPDKWPRMAWLSGHAAELDRSAPPGAGGASRGLLLNQAGLYYQARVDFAAAEPLYRRAMALFESALGGDHPHVATALHNLAALLQGGGRVPEAERLMREAVRIDEAARGRDDPVVAGRLFTLVQLLQASERLGEAAPLQRRVVRIYEATYGADHPNVAMAINVLAELLKALGRWDEAEPLMRRALTIDEKTFGPAHPNVAISLNNLAQLLKSAGRLGEAEELMRRALAIDEAAYGPRHPEVATDLNNFAKLLHATNRLDEAEPMMRRAVAIWEAMYQRDHPDTQVGAENLAQLLRAAGRADEARKVEADYGLVEG